MTDLSPKYGTLFDSSILYLLFDGDEAKRDAYLDMVSPLHMAHKHAPPTLLIHGVSDWIVPTTQSENLASRLAELSVPFAFVPIPNEEHACEKRTSSVGGQMTLYALEQFLRYRVDEIRNPLTA